MKDKYCLPLIKASKAKILDAIEKNLDNYGFFEIWLDYIEDLDEEFLEELLKKCGSKLVFVFRRQNLEPPKIDRAVRDKYIIRLANHPCMIDFDVTTQSSELEYLKNIQGKAKLIASYHNYEVTPTDKELAHIVDQIKSYAPVILKISTMTSGPKDALKLLKIKKDLLESGTRHIVIGMGEHGKITRVFGALWGNELIFIPETISEASAPGQLSREQMDKITDRIAQ